MKTETTSAKTAKNKASISTLELVYMALFVSLTAICAWISIPTAIPFTLQTFSIFLAIGILGTKRATISVLVYIILGSIGVPVFTGFKGGPAALFGLTGGYIVGFLFTALLTGLIISKFGKSVPVMAAAMLLGALVYYTFGTAWFMVLYFQKNGSITLMATLSMCVFPYIIPDCIKIALAVFLTRRLSPFVHLK